MIVQIVFAVQGRPNIIIEKHRDELEKYICGIINNKKCKPLAIYCNPDHTHILLGLHPAISVSDLTRDIKANSTKFINEKKWILGKFSWQDGFGFFTYSKSQIDTVVNHILNNQDIMKGLLLKKSIYEYCENMKLSITNNTYLIGLIKISQLRCLFSFYN